MDAGIGCASIVFTNCPGNCSPAFRGIVGTCQNSNDGVNANMTAYINAYNLTNVPWGILRSFVFENVSDPTPDDSLTVDSSIGTSEWFFAMFFGR